MHAPYDLIDRVTWTHVTVPAGELIFGTPAAGPPQKVWFCGSGDRYVAQGYVN